MRTDTSTVQPANPCRGVGPNRDACARTVPAGRYVHEGLCEDNERGFFHPVAWPIDELRPQFTGKPLGR